jgi:hypothetical protein
MCGAGIENFDNLLQVIAHRTEKTTDRYDKNSKLFLYIKSWCGNSKGAVAKLVNEGFKELTLFDVEKNMYICPEKWTELTASDHVQELGEAWFNNTVPQVFVQNSTTWLFLPGGNASIQKVTVGDTKTAGRSNDRSLQLKW